MTRQWDRNPPQAPFSVLTSMSPRQKGELTEVKILARLVELGIAVSIPFGACHRYDLIIDENGKLSRVQCKTGHIRNGVIIFKVCNVNGFTRKSKHYRGGADMFMVYCPDNDKFYRIPVNAVGTTECSLRLIPCKNQQKQKVRSAEIFEF